MAVGQIGRAFVEKSPEPRELPSTFPVTSANSQNQPDTGQRVAAGGTEFCPWTRQRETKMTPKAPTKSLRSISRRKDLREYTYLGCPITKNRSPWCFRMCKPNAAGIGFCGRVAPHSFKSRIQQGIEDFKKSRSETSTLLRNQEPTHDKDI